METCDKCGQAIRPKTKRVRKKEERLELISRFKAAAMDIIRSRAFTEFKLHPNDMRFRNYSMTAWDVLRSFKVGEESYFIMDRDAVTEPMARAAILELVEAGLVERHRGYGRLHRGVYYRWCGKDLEEAKQKHIEARDAKLNKVKKAASNLGIDESNVWDEGGGEISVSVDGDMILHLAEMTGGAS